MVGVVRSGPAGSAFRKPVPTVSVVDVLRADTTAISSEPISSRWPR